MNYRVIQGNQWHLDGGVMFGNAPKSLWQKWVSADEHNRITMASNCLAAEHSGTTVLVDAGISPFMEPKLNARYCIEGESAELPENLASAGFAPDRIDYIILTHLHFDHVGGILPTWPAMQNAGWEPVFPNAKYILHRRQYERAIDPHPRDKASYYRGIAEKLEATGRLVLLDDGRNIPELENFMTIHVSDAHTPGMIMPLLRDEEDTVFFPGDLISGTPWLYLPIVTGLDRDPEDTIDTKKHYLEQAVQENWLVVFDHDPVTPACRVRINKENGRFEASID